MGFTEEYVCPICRFKYTDYGQGFTYNEKTKSFDYFLLLGPSEDVDDDAEILGMVIQTYCFNCKKIIKNYLITEYPKDVSEEVIINKIEKMIEKPSRLKKFRECWVVTIWDGNQSQMMICPNCNDEVNINNVPKRCPRCHMKLRNESMFFTSMNP